VISRGLLQLLNERELAAVVAHELSHIGNHDTDCSTMIAALVEIVTLPLRVVTGIAIAFAELEWKDGTVHRAFGYALFLVIVMVVGSTYKGLFTAVLTSDWNLRAILAIAPPIYVFIIAPGCATLLRRTMSQQLDFLADADAALLTRDPEGLALALAKVGGALHFTPNADAATAQLYFVDPLPRRSWWDGAYPSHAPIDARIELLARMGDGIPATELRAATEAGAEFGQNRPLVEPAPSPPSPLIVGRPAATDKPVPETPFRLPGTQFRLTDQNTPLYAKPDGWSDVVQRLTSGTTVTFYELVGNFARVATERTAGYISSSTHAVRTDTA
jgi:hypothetical protein